MAMSFTRKSENVVEVDLSKETDAYLAGHTIDGRVLFPETGYLTMVWKTFAKLRDIEFEKLPVVLEEVQFLRATTMPKAGSVKFLINIFVDTGDFEICERDSRVVTGKIRIANNVDVATLKKKSTSRHSVYLEFEGRQVYEELHLRGYDYSGMFRGILQYNVSGIVGKLAWNYDWVSYMDTMLQFKILEKNTHDLYLPSHLQEAIIDPIFQEEQMQEDREGNKSLLIYSYPEIGVIKSGGIAFRNMKVSLARRQQTQAPPKHERYTFVPYDNAHVPVEDPERSKLHALTVLLQIARENMGGTEIKAVEVTGERASEALMAPTVLDILYSEPMLSVDLQIVTTSPDSHAALLGQWKIKAIAKDVQSSPVGQDLHLVLAADMLSKNQTAAMKNLADSLKPGGFLISEETGSITSNAAKKAGLAVVGKQIVPEKSYVLMKKLEDTDQPIIIQITEKSAWLEGFKTALQIIKSKKPAVLVMLQDVVLLFFKLFNCIRQEAGGMNVRYVFILDKNAPKFSLSEAFYADHLGKQLMVNVLKGGQWGSYRHLRLDQQSDVSSLYVEHACINALARGDLSSLRWIEGPLSYCQPEKFSDKEFCSVYYAPLNFRDIMLATGKLNVDALPGGLAGPDCIPGLEFAGRDSKGHRVMGMVAAQGLATTVLADPGFMWEVPDKWTLEQAATIPVAYATSYYALCVRGNMKPGESVLIHAGSGDVGQASIAIALHMGCKVFTTVGSQEQRDFLKKIFPRLDNIGNSRDTSFEQLIINKTNGRGVDLVLNSLDCTRKFQASVGCLANSGRFLEIGKFDSSNNTVLDMSLFPKTANFHGILLDALFDADCPEKKELVRLVSEGIENGAVRPLPATVFSEQQIEQGFRFMATGKHIGKVMLKIRDEESQKICHPTPKTVASIPRTYMNPDKSYVVVGGLSDLGLELVNWLVTRGAKHIVIPCDEYIKAHHSLRIRRWLYSDYFNLKIVVVKVTTEADIKKLMKVAEACAPVGGILNVTSTFEDDTENNLNNLYMALAVPQIKCSNLDSASRKLCPALDYFVTFSSVSCGRGNAGQTNYGLANSAMEIISENFQTMELPGLVILWNTVDDINFILETMDNNETEVGGTLPQRMSSCLTAMDTLLHQPHPLLASVVVLAEKHKSTDTGNQVGLLEAVFQLSDSEIMPTKSLPKLNTRKSEGAPIFVVPAFEGVIASLKSLAQESDRPIYGFQCTKAAPLDTITDFARFNIMKMRSVQAKGPYTLVGYSFGALVAFEMALQLEQVGEQINLTLVDGSPEFITQHCQTIDKQTAGQNNENLEADGTRKALAFFTRQMNPNIGFLKAYSILGGTKSKDEMYEKMVELIESTPFSPEDLKQAGILFCKKLRAANSYKPAGKFQGPVTLIKAKDNFVLLNSDYGLSQICKQNVTIVELPGNHRSIMSGDSVKKIAELLRS